MFFSAFKSSDLTGTILCFVHLMVSNGLPCFFDIFAFSIFSQVYDLVPNEEAARGGGGGVATKDLPKGANLSRRSAMR